jgi:HD-GYP domain-containing protein (c-di-GMP phosphodiesterase class II)
MDQLINAIATALDIVEGELLGASTHHGKRISVLVTRMGRELGMSEDQVRILGTCALLHDNALTEYIFSERAGRMHDPAMKLHCEYGQSNVESFLPPEEVDGLILNHHEMANGKGPYGKKAKDVPLGAQLIAVADTIDVGWHLQRIGPERLKEIRSIIGNGIGEKFTFQAAKVMLDVLDEKTLESLRDEHIFKTVESSISPWFVDIEDKIILNLAGFVTRIIDYKSVFTQRHSTQIANKAWLLGGYYGYDLGQRASLYLAAALHDIGKLATPLDILEKPEQLTREEFLIIKEHARMTRQILTGIGGFEQICEWASSHHERLDGSGYVEGKKADELDFNSRLLACVDIYQAISEERPYHPARNHRDTMEILYPMVEEGLVDKTIVEDMEKTFAVYDAHDIPPPVAPVFTPQLVD